MIESVLKGWGVFESEKELSNLRFGVDIFPSDCGDLVKQDIKIDIGEQLGEVLDIVTNLAQDEMLIQSFGRWEW